MIFQVFHFFKHLAAQKRAFFVPFANYSALNLLVEFFGAHFGPNFHCSTQFHANFLIAKKFVLWVFTFLEDKKSIPDLYHR